MITNEILQPFVRSHEIQVKEIEIPKGDADLSDSLILYAFCTFFESDNGGLTPLRGGIRDLTSASSRDRYLRRRRRRAIAASAASELRSSRRSSAEGGSRGERTATIPRTVRRSRLSERKTHVVPPRLPNTGARLSSTVSNGARRFAVVGGRRRRSRATRGRDGYRVGDRRGPQVRQIDADSSSWHVARGSRRYPVSHPRGSRSGERRSSSSPG